MIKKILNKSGSNYMAGNQTFTFYFKNGKKRYLWHCKIENMSLENYVNYIKNTVINDFKCEFKDLSHVSAQNYMHGPVHFLPGNKIS